MATTILKLLKQFETLSGYLGAGVFSPEGEMLGGVTEVSGINFEIAGGLFHDAFLFTQNNSREAGFGYIDMVRISTQNGIIFGKCFREEKAHFHTLLVVTHDCNLAMATLMLDRVVAALKKELVDDAE